MIHSMMPETAQAGCDLKRVELPTWKLDSIWGLALHAHCFPALLGGVTLVFRARMNHRRSSSPRFRRLANLGKTSHFTWDFGRDVDREKLTTNGTEYLRMTASFLKEQKRSQQERN